MTRKTRAPLRRWLWTADGRFFGYRDGDELWSKNGRHVGRFSAGDIHAPDGCYIGELHRERLVTCPQKRMLRIEPFEQLAGAHPMTAFEATRRIALPSGYVEFSSATVRHGHEPERSHRVDG